MFYRMTRLHFAEDRFEQLVESATSLRNRVEGIPGLRFAELIRTGEGEGMIISSYHDSIAFQESALSLDDAVLHANGYTPEAYRDALQRQLRAATQGLPRSRVFWYMNFRPGSRSTSARSPPTSSARDS